MAVVLGIRGADNPTDQLAAVLVFVPLCLVFADFFVVGWMLFKTVGLRALGLPIGGVVLHLLIWGWAQYLAAFEVFYRLQMHDEVYGVYEVRVGIAVLLGGLNVLAVGMAVYIIGVTGQLLADVIIPIVGNELEEDDVPLDGDYIFDTQVLLNNIGYDIGGIDGVLGPKTETALKQFQAVTGLVSNGGISTLTLDALRRRSQQREKLSLIQTFLTFARYFSNRLVGFCELQWFKLRNR
ncbi:MAG: hypothetical protein HOE48_22885 [Candidatus Latescibacteria bacterium]|nr:hypothetical protein [Candidatus Latescibacterota bacterium]